MGARRLGRRLCAREKGRYDLYMQSGRVKSSVDVILWRSLVRSEPLSAF